MDPQEQQLVERASRGDPPALDALLERHLPGLRAWLRQRAGPELRAAESVSDIAQSVCREALQEADRFDYQGDGPFRSWLYQVALSKVRDRHKYWLAQKRDRRREEPGEGADPPGYLSMLTPSRALVGLEEMERVEACLDRMPEEYREVMLLSRLEGLGNQEIAARLGRTEGSVRGLLQRAKARLSWMLAAEDPDDDPDGERPRAGGGAGR